jgi:hypothetical protein
MAGFWVNGQPTPEKSRPPLYRRLPSLLYRGLPNPQGVWQSKALTNHHAQPIWKSAIQQVWQPAVRGLATCLYRRLPSLPYRGLPNPLAVCQSNALTNFHTQPIWKSAIRQVWKPAVRGWHLPVPQTSKSAVSRVSKPAGGLPIQSAHEPSYPADLEIGDTAGLATCGTGACHLPVPQTSKSAVSRVAKPADRLAIRCAHELSHPADLEIGDTAGLATCGIDRATPEKSSALSFEGRWGYVAARCGKNRIRVVVKAQEMKTERNDWSHL